MQLSCNAAKRPAMTAHDSSLALRAALIGTLARATAAELGAALATHWPDLAFRELKPVETGLVMLRGRMGGDGAAFNLGEATVSRAVVELPTGERGYGQCLGRDAAKARTAAILDALAQRDTDRAIVEAKVVEPVRERLTLARKLSAEQTAATKVDFFTLVRGDD
jgi:alpha-D-ribose 1-methylphosphonate 5-triphosphate synthase subunit PhnG